MNTNNRSTDIPISSSVFFTNSLKSDRTERIEDLRNSIVEDQFDLFKKRNHYLRKSVIVVDSINKNDTDIISSNEIDLLKIGFLMSSKYPGQIFLYIPSEDRLDNNSSIYFTNLTTLTSNINGINTKLLQFDPISKTPIFNLMTVSNKAALEIFGWATINNLINGQYESEEQFITGKKGISNSNFFCFFYTNTTNISLNNYCTLFITKKPKIFKLLDRVLGYPNTSYFKIILAKTFSNIYKIKLLDINLPDIIFNINNDMYTFNNYSYKQNGKIRFIMYDDQFLVSNIDYVGARVKYDFWNKKAIYDVNGFNRDEYKFSTVNSTKYPHFYLANDIYQLMMNILNTINTTADFLDYTNKNIFQVAYFFLQQFHLHYNTDVFAIETNNYNNTFFFQPRDPNVVNRIYYIYTSDIVNSFNTTSKFILRQDNTLNIKNPLVYFNDYLLYVNNETFNLNLSVCNWMDKIILDKTNISITEDFGFCKLYCLVNNVDERLVGVIQDIDVLNSSSFAVKSGGYVNNSNNSKDLNYKISLDLINSNFKTNSINNKKVYALYTNTSTNYIDNIVKTYLYYSVSDNTYYYQINLDFSNKNYKAIDTDIFQYGSTVYEMVDQNLINDSENMFNKDYISYILVLGNTPLGFVPGSIIGSTIYSRINTDSNLYIANTVKEFIGTITTNELYSTTTYVYKMYSYNQAAFSKYTLIYIFNGTNYSFIGNAMDILDVYYNVQLVNNIDGFYPGMVITTLNENKLNVFLKDLGNQYYFTAYSSQELLNYRSSILIKDEKIYNNSNLKGTVSVSYQPIGTIEDVQFDLILDASLYLSQIVNYDTTTVNTNNTQSVYVLETKTLGSIGNTPQTSYIKLDNIRIIETKTQTKNNIIEYTNKNLVFKNNVGQTFETQILSQPKLVRNLNMFIFNLSLKTPGIDIGKIYSTKSYVCSVDGETIGTGYSIYYSQIDYTLVIEKADDFQMEYLQNWGIYVYTKYPKSKFIPEANFINRNYSSVNPKKTNLTGLQNYNMIPFYEITIDNGNYDNITLVNKIESELNKTSYLTFDYLKKTLDTKDIKNYAINYANYESPRFKVLFNDITKKIEIKCYKIINHIFYKAFYNPINPFIYFKIDNANIENNKRIYIEVLRDAANNNYTNELAKRLNQEYTTRILPMFEYEIRIISPSPGLQYINNLSQIDRLIPNSIRDILDQISINPSKFRTKYPVLNDEMRFVGQSLKNIFKNSNTYTGAGKTVFNVGVPCSFQENELVMVINNIYFNYEAYKIGRLVNIKDKFSNYKGNYRIRIQLSGIVETSQPIFIGDIIYGLNSKTIGCVVPYEWGIMPEIPELAQFHAGLPPEDIIRLGYKNYLKLLYQLSGREYFMELINKYSMENFLHYNSYIQNNLDVNKYNITSTYNSLNSWPIEQVENCFTGFEISFDFPVPFEIIESELVLNFLKENQYCLLLGKNTEGIYDTPKDILGFNSEKILNINDFINSETPIPWNTMFDNTNDFAHQNISKMYITYGSDNILQNKIYIVLDDISDYKIGDTVYLNNLNVKTNIQRNIFNIYSTNNYNVQRMFSFDIYLTFIAMRLAFIKSGIPIPMGPNDYLGLFSKGIAGNLYMWQFLFMRIPNSIYVQPNTNILDFFSIIYENYRDNMNYGNYPGMDEKINSNLKNIPPLSSTNIVEDYAYIINKIILGKILPWFINEDNLLLWTKGSINDYVYLLETYIYITGKNIWRFELEVMDDFFFKENLLVKDKNGNIIGRASMNDLYKDSTAINNTFYTLYIKIFPEYNVLNNIAALDYIYAEDMGVKNRIKTKPIFIDDTNKYIYLYDTYLKFKTIAQIVSNNNDTIQKTLNFNSIDSINSLLMNLQNLDNQNITSFKNGFYASFNKNEIYWDNSSNNITGCYRIMLNILDNKNLLHICFNELGLINNFTEIKNNIINMPSNTVKDIVQIRTLLDIFQLLIDLSPINTVMIDLNFNQELENNIHKTFQYEMRLIDNVFSICGSRNFYIENISYRNKYIYGDKNNPDGHVIVYLNNYFSNIYSNLEVEKYKKDGTIDQNMCNLTNIYNKNKYGAEINDQLLIFKEPNNFVYGVLWVPLDPGEKSMYVIIPNYDSGKLNTSNKSVFLFNKNNLANYLITINFIYVDQHKSININNIEENETIQSNIIESIIPIINSNETFDLYKLPAYAKDSNGKITSSKMPTHRIFKINLKYPVKYNAVRGTLIQIKDYYTTIYKQPNTKIKDNFKLLILQNWTSDNQFVLKSGYTIRINYGSYNSIYQNYINTTNNFTEQLNSFDVDDIIHEETNIIASVSTMPIEINGKKYWELVLQNSIKYEFKSGIPIIISFNPQNISSYTPCINNVTTPYDLPFESISDTVMNNNDILTNGLATQNIIVDGEWYTKIFYQGEKNMDLYDLNSCGVKSINNSSNKQVYISNMKGYILPNVGFQNIERNYYNSIEVNLETTQTNNNIKPVPDGLYSLVKIQKEDNLKILNNNNDLTISGFYQTVYCNNTPEQEDEWIDNFENVRWFYATEYSNKNLTSLNNTDLYELNPFINNLNFEPGTIFDKLCKVISVEATGFIYEEQNVYKVFILLNTKNIINNFLYQKLNFNTIFQENSNKLIYDTYLSNREQTYKIKIIYYGLRESVDYNYSNTIKRHNYYSITIKGRYQGFGGSICFNNLNNIFNTISYTISDIKSEYNTVELDILNNPNIYCSYYRFISTGFNQNIKDMYIQNYNKLAIKTTQNNPVFTGFNQVPLQKDNDINDINEIINTYDIYPSKFGFLADSGILYKKTINKPVSTKTYDYIYLCFKNIPSDVVVEQDNNIGNNIIFAKIYTKLNDLNNFYLDYTNYEVIYDLQLMPKLNEIEVFFLDKSGNLVNFNNLDVNFQLEIHEYVERVKNINTTNAMVF